MYFVSFWQWQLINYWDLGINSKVKFPGQARHNKVRLSLGIGRLGSEGFCVGGYGVGVRVGRPFGSALAHADLAP